MSITIEENDFVDMLAEAGQLPLLSHEQEVILARRIAGGDRAAKEQFIQANLRLVASIARRYVRKQASFEDVFQDGCIGLMRAVDKFDPERGFRFSTHATWWIRQAIIRPAEDREQAIHLPVHVREDQRALRAIALAFEVEHGHEPSAYELSALSGKRLERVLAAQQSFQVLSLDEPLGDEDEPEFTLASLLEDPADDFSEFVAYSEQQQLLCQAMSSLSSRERDILCRRYGIDRDAQTLEQIAKVCGLTRERIRQIEVRALERIRVRIHQLTKHWTKEERMAV